jgi:DNA-binding response OmpR family regulator
MSDKPHILVIEEDDAIQALLSEILTDAGYEVTLASDGRMALNLAPTIKPHLILLDLHPRFINGSEFIQQYSPGDETHPPIVVLAAPATVKHLIPNLRVVAHLPKPFEIDTVLRTVHDHVLVSGHQPHELLKGAGGILGNPVGDFDVNPRGNQAAMPQRRGDRGHRHTGGGAPGPETMA